MAPSPTPPGLLIASHHTAAALELQQLVARRGYAVRRAYTGTQALDLARADPPDVLVLDQSLPDIDVLDASRALRADPQVGPGTPLLLITAGRPSTLEHHAALRAGVWEYLSLPFHAEEIAARLDTYVLLKLDADRVRRDTAMTDESGFYTRRGLALRAQELTLQAFHHAEPLACLAFAPVPADERTARTVDLVAEVLRGTGRRSDAVGRVGPGEFAVIAPGTDHVGAVLFAERVARAISSAAPGGAAPSLRAGYDAVANARYTAIEPKKLLARATTALRTAKGLGGQNWIQGFGG
ncbi:MAG TPA: response regulator [Gemmatimonadales bacterium]|nr:response regulator [Gemmatimonadales bacterium]